MGITRFVRDKIETARAKTEYKNDIVLYNKLINDNRFAIKNEDCLPILYDKNKEAGIVDPHYFLQDIYMAKEVIKLGEKNHYDIGSRIEGFISHLLISNTIDSITLLDVRPLSIIIPKLNFIQTDATTLENIPDCSIKSLSSLHAIEHFGLGRYGDKIDPDGWQKALLSMQKKLAVGGTLFLSVPIGIKEKVCFNAHRIFLPQTIVDTLDLLTLKAFSYIHSYKIFDSTPEKYLHTDGVYDCGLFIFRKE